MLYILACPEKFYPASKPQRFLKPLRFGPKLIWMTILSLLILSHYLSQ